MRDVSRNRVRQQGRLRLDILNPFYMLLLPDLRGTKSGSFFLSEWNSTKLELSGSKSKLLRSNQVLTFSKFLIKCFGLLSSPVSK